MNDAETYGIKSSKHKKGERKEGKSSFKDKKKNKRDDDSKFAKTKRRRPFVGEEEV